MKFFTGLCNVYHAEFFRRSMISVNRLSNRVSDFLCGEWILDSGAFTAVSTHGDHAMSCEEYAARVLRWANCGELVAAVSQDYMCETFVLSRTGQSVATHQALTVARYDRLRELLDGGPYLMPVLQGYTPLEYRECLRLYGNRLTEGQWVGVGSVCKRNATPAAVVAILSTVAADRPDLRLHGFGLKRTALESVEVRGLLHSADSMAWSFAARYEGRDRHSWKEAYRYARTIVGPGDRP